MHNPAGNVETTSEPSTVSPLGGFLSEYRRPEGFYDEFVTSSGELRPHWRAFANSVNALGTSEFRRRWQESQRLVHENGIAYSPYGSPGGKPRPWELDPLPLLIPEADWISLAEALQQRATLLNLILADLYGPQKLLQRGGLPPEVVFRHPGFLDAYHGQNPTGDRYLHCYAADLARSPDGRWWVLGDRTEAPSGIGYALENRIVSSRMLPDAFRECRVQRLAPYFIALREMLGQQATTGGDNPRIVLLTQGPEYPNYFEDAYLARYLGFTLAHGDDLTVRSAQVMLKTLGGLLPVDVILRRPNSEHCDPLELSSIVQGAAGLMQATRRRNVVVANAMGSGLVESPVFMAFLPQLCKTVLGQRLLMPGVATWWCGTPKGLSHVLDNLDNLLIRPAFRGRGREVDQTKRFLSLSKDQMVAAIRAEPEAYVGQESVTRSSMPMWSASTAAAADNDRASGSVASSMMQASMAQSTMGQAATMKSQSGTNPSPPPTVQASHIAMRAFAAAGQDGYHVMPGALARVSDSDQPLFASLLAGERSKDVWILAEKSVSQVTLLDKLDHALPLTRGGAELPSRVADHVFWLGRHLERADAAARLLRTIAQRITAEVYSANRPEVSMLVRVLAEQGHIEAGYVVEGIREQLPDIEKSLPAFVFDESQPESLRAIISQLFQAASVVRDRISVDCWRVIHRLDEQFHRPVATSLVISDVLVLIDSLIIDLSAFSGMAMESMTRTHTWRFLDLGRRLERALQTASLIRYALGDPATVQSPVLETVLEVADSLMTYRSRYLANLQLGPVLDLLLTDETNPRSVAFQLASVANHVDALPRERTQPVYGSEQRLAMAVLHSVRMLDVQSLAEIHALGNAEQLDKFLENLIARLPELSDAISHKYLVHSGTSHRLDAIRPE